MSLIDNSLLLGQEGGGGYAIQRSLRFNSSDSAYLSRTPASAGNRKTWTWAGWVKRSGLGARQNIFGTGDTSFFNGFWVEFFSDDKIRIGDIGPSIRDLELITTQVFRDCSAWGHLLVALDTTQTTAANRLSVYWNGSKITTFDTASYPSQNFDTRLNTTADHGIGRAGSYNAQYFSGYLADIHFIDGQALDPTSFGEFSATTGVWMPKAYIGSYGTNGFRLPFSDNSAATSTTLGKDSAGSNDWTPNNLSVTAGSGNDSLVDTPTSYGTDTGAGGEVRGNYCTWNPLINGDTAANGNLDVTNDTARGTQKLLEYDAYWEITSTGGTTTAGIVSDGGTTNTTTVANGKTYGFKLSAAGSLEYINITDGGSFTSITTGLTGVRFPYASAASATTGSLNAGQRPFAATAPSGFKALCDTNLPAPVVTKPSTVMDVLLYTGNNTARSITGLGFSPDFVWIKGRSGATDHALYDIVRGVEKDLVSNSTAAETTQTTGLTAFNSDGFSIGTLAKLNTNSATYVAWAWDAGSSTVTNTVGSISSQVRANASAGFSVVTYTGTGAAGSVGHGLGVTPGMIIVKARSNTTNNDWMVYHSRLANPPQDALRLNSTGTPYTNNTYPWNSSVTSTVFGVSPDSSYGISSSGVGYVAYCFAPVAGYSSFGSYTGGGSEYPFVYCGFRPRWILIKNTSTGGTFYDWHMVDTARNPYNFGALNSDSQYTLFANTSGQEQQWFSIDMLSNGFRVIDQSVTINNSGSTFIYAAFAEQPFQYARAR